MNIIVNISNKFKVLLLVVIFTSLFACSKGGEPIPMASTTQNESSTSLIQNDSHNNSTERVVGGDDKEDDDDKGHRNSNGL